MISRVNLKFDDPALMEKSKIDGSHRSVITPAKLGGPKQVRDLSFICKVSFFFFCSRVGQFNSNEIDLIKVTRHFRSIAVKGVNDVRDKMLLLCFAKHQTID